MDRTCIVALALCASGLAVALLVASREPRPTAAGAGAPVLATWVPDAKRAGPLTEPAR